VTCKYNIIPIIVCSIIIVSSNIFRLGLS